MYTTSHMTKSVFEAWIAARGLSVTWNDEAERKSGIVLDQDGRQAAIVNRTTTANTRNRKISEVYVVVTNQVVLKQVSEQVVERKVVQTDPFFHATALQPYLAAGWTVIRTDQGIRWNSTILERVTRK